MKQTIYWLVLFSFLAALPASATHNRAGEITYRQTGNLSIESSILTYSKASSVPADRDSLQICWGDGHCEWAIRVNGPDLNNNGIPDGELLENDFKRNEYTLVHTYAALGVYTIAVADPNRNEGILNMANSGGTQFYIATDCALFNAQFHPYNHSPIPLVPPIDLGYIGQPFYHTPNAIDPDGDSIAYEMITPLVNNGTEVATYVPVTDIVPGANNQLSFDEVTGLLIWDAPQMAGEYNIAIAIKSYRSDSLIGTLIRDIQILIKEEENMLPRIQIDQDWEDKIVDVQVNDTIRLKITASDLDKDQHVIIQAYSSLFELYATQPRFELIPDQTNDEEIATFTWVVAPDQLSEQVHQLAFKTSDNLGLANFQILRFRVQDVLNNHPELYSPEAIRISPNPASNWIQIDPPIDPSKRYSIWDRGGRLVQKGVLNGHQIRIDELANGWYVLKMEERAIQAFIKQ